MRKVNPRKKDREIIKCNICGSMDEVLPRLVQKSNEN